ncbi:MAG: hypothetical protein ROD09_15295 [Candidatus Sedimenticola sp. (ex Thyasira tokunagai)]
MDFLADPVWGGVSGLIALVGLIIVITQYRRSHHSKSGIKSDSLPASEVHELVERLISLLKTHGVERTQIPKFLGAEAGITFTDLSDDDKLISKLDDELLDSICERLAVRREWLDGESEQIYPRQDFYQHPDAFSKFLSDLKNCNPKGRLRGLVVKPIPEHADGNALLILQETIGYIGEKPIYRYHLSDGWLFSYWKVRGYLTACVAIGWKRKVYIHGVEQLMSVIDLLASGEVLLGWEGEGFWALGSTSWHPEDMASDPKAYLDGVDPEMDNFGIKAGLRLWLDLDEQGLMDCGFDGKHRQAFEEALERYEIEAA